MGQELLTHREYGPILSPMNTPMTSTEAERFYSKAALEAVEYRIDALRDAHDEGDHDDAIVANCPECEDRCDDCERSFGPMAYCRC